MDRIAIIDMGTNTFHLLVADIDGCGHPIVHRDHEAVRIGVGGINRGLITDEASLRAIAAMKKFRKAMDKLHVSTVHAFATSAFRNAGNGRALAAEIEAVTNIPVQIISGDTEAGYIFEGIKSAIHIGPENCLVMDIGAGSVEFIIGNNERILWKQSFEIGGQRLLEKYHKHDPILNEEITALNVCFEETLVPLMAAIAELKPRVLVGSSGSFDTLSDIFCHRAGIPHQPGASETPLTLEGFYEIYGELIRKNREERMKIPGMISLRVELIVVGCCLIRFLLEKHAFTGVRVSRWSLKEGVLATIARVS